jgi:hypothetical protein
LQRKDARVFVKERIRTSAVKAELVVPIPDSKIIESLTDTGANTLPAWGLAQEGDSRHFSEQIAAWMA